MRYMINLRHLFLDGCSRLKCMPIGLGQLKCLQTLTKYVADSGKGGSIKEFIKLKLLSGRISLSGLESIRDSEDARIVNLAAKTNLCSLKLKWDQTDNKEGMKNYEQAVMETLRPHNELKYLDLYGYSGFGFLKWMMETSIIRNLKRLKLKGCINCAELSPLWKLSLLEKLCLSRMKSLRHIVSGTCNYVEGIKSIITFLALMKLKLYDLSNLESWHEEESELVVFPKLNELVIEYCPKLKSVPVHVPLLAELHVWKSGEIKLRPISNLPVLSNLVIVVDTPLSGPDAFRPPKTLEKMDIRRFENVSLFEEEEEEEEEENQLISISSETKLLRKLTMIKSHCFFSCGLTKAVALRFWKKYFAALEYLKIDECDALVFWP